MQSGGVNIERGGNSNTKDVNNVASSPSSTSVSGRPELLLGVRLESLSSRDQFLFCAGGILVFFVMYGYIQEATFRIEGMKPHALYLTLVQFVLYTIFAYIEMTLQKQTRKIPLSTYTFLAFLTLSTMGLSNYALGYLNYPTMVIFKSCKLIPVMIGSMVIVGRRYGPFDVAAVLLLCVGLAWFTLADSMVYPEFSTTGIALIMLALCADALIGNYQEKAMKHHSTGNTEVVLYSYSIGFVYLFIGLITTGHFLPSVAYFNKSFSMKYGHLLLYALSGYMGIKFVLTTIKLFGALVAVTVTTFRKVWTMILSFMVFSKPFTIQYLWSGLVILIGISLNVYSKNRSKIDPWIKQHVSMIDPWITRQLPVWRRPPRSASSHV